MNLRHAFFSLRSYLRKRDGLKVNPERVVIIVLALALMFSLGVQLGQAQGRAPSAAPAARPAAPATTPFADSIPIQGRLTNAGGSPLTGSYAMTFNIYNVPSGGSALCTWTNPTVAVSNGLWNATIDDCGGGGGLFAGGDTQLYVGIQVGADAEMTPRQPLYAVPYAQGLLTPLEVSGASTSAILTVVNAGSGRAANFTGDVGQQRLNSGLVKAGALVLCASAGSFAASVYRSFNDVNNTAVTIVGGASSGKCTVDFGFQISGIGNTGRYYVASPRANLARAVSCGENVTNTKLDCNYFDPTTGTGIDGDIEILIY
jgi:hypothetical protein